MKVTSVFRIKFVYSGEEMDGSVVKKRLEVLAQCTTYTEAEKLANVIIERNNMERFDECSYEIILTKIAIGDILYNTVLNEDTTLVMGLSELFFEGELDAIYSIRVKFFGNKEEKTKDTVSEYLVPGETINDAVNYIKKFLKNKRGMADGTFCVLQSKVDNMENLYLMPIVLDAKKAESIK